MTYAKGNNVLAADINSLTGTINALGAYPSAADATSKAAALWGIGYGDRGYGESSPALSKRTVGNPNELLWLCKPSGDGAADGGWDSAPFSIDHTKKYRSAVWIKVQNGSGSVYHGLGPYGNSNTLNLDGSVNTNAYWLQNSATVMAPGQWYLSVGIVHESAYAGGYSGTSGLYDMNGNKVLAYPEFKHASNSTFQNHRCYHYYDSDSTQRQWFARPRFEQVTGTEPSISTLLSASVDALPLDTLVTPSQWVTGSIGSGAAVGMFNVSQSQGTESEIILANGEGPTGSLIKAKDFLDLRNVISTMATHQGIATTLLPPTSEFAVGGVAKAHVPATTSYDFPTMLANVDANRLSYVVSNMTFTNATTITRSSTWGAGTGGITCEFSVTFASEDAARFFFNTGGELRISLSHPNTATPRNSSWNTVLNGFVAAFRAHNTARTGGSYGTAQAIGYYELTTAYQTIVNGANLGVSPYGVNDFYVEAKSASITGANGAKGSVLHFRVRLIDEQTNAWSDIVASGTAATIGHLRQTAGGLTAKAAPSCAAMTLF